MHSCLYLQVCTERGGRDGGVRGADCSTVLGLFTSRSEGGSLPELTDVHLFVFFSWGGGGGGEWVKGRGHMHGVRELVQPSTTQLVTRKQNTAKKRLLLIGQHHVTPTGNLELLVKTLSTWTAWVFLCLIFFFFLFFFNFTTGYWVTNTVQGRLAPRVGEVLGW